MAQLSPDLNVDSSGCLDLRNSPAVLLEACMNPKISLSPGCLVHWNRPKQRSELAGCLAGRLAAARPASTALAWKQYSDMVPYSAVWLMVVLGLAHSFCA